ncbi:ribosomal maturation YjgA family protein [Sediminitomix flava]|uniref:Uncharacterized protein DUF2809 n=1 Tax=Sediminitomix flava TaxID=379075 RepID=A0A315ZCR4_SEDFL|nr:DUF2809 domain-containing protein [Sediminitomix flava]PWJ43100.1 uncharacterized protein DUF2809 [Sediminitomix flava]
MNKKQIFLGLALGVFLFEVLLATILKDTFLRPTFGDYLVVILMYALPRAVINIRPIVLGISVLLFAYFIEFGQYIDILNRLGIQKNTFTNLTLGHSFDWYDILAYTLGVMTVLIFDLAIISKKLEEKAV